MLDTPVPMQQHPEEFAALLAIFQARRPRRVLEVGSYAGGTLYHWLRGSPEIVVAVDDFRAGIDNRALYADWTPRGTRLELVVGDSRAEATRTAVEQHAPFDWVFIDADHSYEAVRADWGAYAPLCDGMVVLHDILPPSPAHPEIQVSRLWGEIKAERSTLELIEDRHAPWGGIGVVDLSA